MRKVVYSNIRGFTLIEIMIAFLIAGTLGLLMTNYMKRSSQGLASSDRSAVLDEESQMTSKLLSEEIVQAAYLNPSCDSNPIAAGVTLDCDDLIVRGGVTPLPGVSREDVDSMTTFLNPSNLIDLPASLTDDNDAIRLVEFDADMECALNRTIANNPSDAEEKIFVDSTSCSGELIAGRLYILMETSAGVVFSSLFQVTSVNNVATPTEITISSSGGSPFNVPGGLGIAGYSNAARIYSVKIVEYAVSSIDEGLWRREIRPDGTSDLSGYGDWVEVQRKVESMQFFPMTVTASGPLSHNRTLQLTSDTGNDGVEDIRGVSPRVVLKSAREETDGTTYDNPITSTTEADAFPRRELNFYVSLLNARF